MPKPFWSSALRSSLNIHIIINNIDSVHIHARSRTHIFYGSGTEEMVFEKRKVFKEYFKEMT